MAKENQKNDGEATQVTVEKQKIAAIEKKLDIVIEALKCRPSASKYVTAQMIEEEYGIDQRTILNRSNLPVSDRRYIPSLRMNGRRKYFERKVIERLLKLSE